MFVFATRAFRPRNVVITSFKKYSPSQSNGFSATQITPICMGIDDSLPYYEGSAVVSQINPAAFYTVSLRSILILYSHLPLDTPRGASFIFIHSFSSLSYDRSKAPSKASSPHSAIQSFLFQLRVSSPFLKAIQ